MTTQTPATTHAPVEGRGRLLVGLLAAVVCVAFESVAVATAMPQAARDLGGLGLYAWAFTLFVLGMVFSTAVAGRWCDRTGPLRPLALGMGLFVGGLLLAGAATSMPVLVAARFVQGAGGGAMNLCLMVVVAEAFGEDERARTMTWFSVCWLMPAFVGPPVSAAVTHHWGWHWVFWMLVPLLAVASGLAARPLLAVQSRWRRHPGDGDPVPLWAAGATAVAAALLQAAGQLRGAAGAGLAVVAAALLLAAVPRIMPAGFLRLGRGLPAVVWTRGAQAGAFFAAEAFLPLSLVTLRGLGLFRAGLVLTVGSLGWTAGSWLQSRAWLRLRRDQVVRWGLVASAGGIAAAAASAATGHRHLVLVLAGWVLAGLGMGLGIAGQSLAVMQLAPAGQLGRSTSSLQTADSLGNSLVAGLGGAIFSLSHESPAAFAPIFCAAALVAVAGVLVSGRIGPVPTTPPGAVGAP